MQLLASKFHFLEFWLLLSRVAPYYSSLPRTVWFYGLTRLHKQGIPLRPIVACTKANASNIGKWLCTAFKPLLFSQKSYICNSVDLVENSKT